MKVLALFRDFPRPDDRELKKLEANDRIPRVTILGAALNADILDRRRLERVPAFRRTVYRFLPLEVAQVIEAFLIRKRYDAVLSWGERLGFSFALLCKLAGDRSVPHVAMCSWPGKGFKAVMLRLVHSHIDRVILWSTVQRAIVVDKIKIPPKKIVFINYFVDQKFFRPMGRESDMICSVGSEMRDFPTLLDALKGVDIRCHIAAGTLNGVQTPWVNTIERVRELPPNVTVGGKTPAALRELYARSRFVVIPLLESDTDNGITCILEAMAMGKPVICSRIKGQVDVIQDGKTGIFVPVGDSKALREAILYLWSNPREAERMGRAGRKYVEECQTLDKFVSNLHAVVKTTIAVRNPESVLSTPKNSAMLSNAASTVAVGEE
jgi:glycosyltransferase involved in cell wall biosynthesis